MYLVWDFVALCVMFVHTFGIWNFSGNWVTFVVRYRDTDRNIDILWSLDGDLLADLLGQNLAAGLVAMMRSTMRSGTRAMGRGTPDTTMDIAVGYGGVTNTLVHRVTLGLVVQLETINILHCISCCKLIIVTS